MVLTVGLLGLGLMPQAMQRADTTHLAWVKRELRLEMLTTALGKERSDEVAAATDPEVVKAMESLPRAKALLDKAKRMVAQKAK